MLGLCQDLLVIFDIQVEQTEKQVGMHMVANLVHKRPLFYGELYFIYLANLSVRNLVVINNKVTECDIITLHACSFWLIKPNLG